MVFDLLRRPRAPELSALLLTSALQYSTATISISARLTACPNTSLVDSALVSLFNFRQVYPRVVIEH
jgi:hypothetical protein